MEVSIVQGVVLEHNESTKVQTLGAKCRAYIVQ